MWMGSGKFAQGIQMAIHKTIPAAAFLLYNILGRDAMDICLHKAQQVRSQEAKPSTPTRAGLIGMKHRLRADLLATGKPTELSSKCVAQKSRDGIVSSIVQSNDRERLLGPDTLYSIRPLDTLCTTSLSQVGTE